MNTNICRKLDKFNVLRRSYLRIAAVFVLAFGTVVFMFSPSAEAQTVYYLQNDQSAVGTSKNWNTAGDWSGGIAPGSTNGAIFTVGDGYMLRAPGNSGIQTFPYNGSGDFNSLYLGYNRDATNFDSGYLNIKCETVVINNLVLGNGTVYQGNDNLTETIQGTITVNGNAYLTINNTNSSDSRSMKIESSIFGAGTLNLTTGVKTDTASKIGFYLVSASNAFSGAVIIDNKSRIVFNAPDVFVNASSVTSAGVLTILADQTFNNALYCSNGSITLNGKDNNIFKSGNLILKKGGRLDNLSYRVTESDIPDATTRNQFILTHGNITNNGNQDLTLNNSSDSTYSGVITSDGKLIKTGDGTLTLNSTVDKSINCDVEINGGTVRLTNCLSSEGGTLVYKDRFGGNVTINEGGTLACNAKDAYGNGTSLLTLNINGGTLLLNTSNNQTLTNKTVNFTQGTIKAGESYPDCQGIEVKTGTTFNVHALEGATAENPTISTISVPIKIREDHGLNITVDKNAQLIFSNAVFNESYTVEGIYKYGEGVVTFSYDSSAMEGKHFSEEIIVKKGVFQLTNDAVMTTGPIEVENDGTLEIHVPDGETKKTIITTRRIDNRNITNSIFSTGEVIKTGDGTLQLCVEAAGLVSAESVVVSSGRMDAKGYINGKLSVSADAMLSPGNSIGSLSIDDFIIGDVTHSGELILNETGSKLLMEIGGSAIDENDSLIVSGDLTLHEGSIIYLAATDDCDLQPGETFTAVLSGNNSSAIAGNFISRYVRTTDFIDLQYIQLNGSEYGSNNGKYAITGRYYIDPNAVPEPSTWALLILGVAGLLCLKKLQKK